MNVLRRGQKNTVRLSNTRKHLLNISTFSTVVNSEAQRWNLSFSLAHMCLYEVSSLFKTFFLISSLSWILLNMLKFVIFISPISYLSKDTLGEPRTKHQGIASSVCYSCWRAVHNLCLLRKESGLALNERLAYWHFKKWSTINPDSRIRWDEEAEIQVSQP